VSKKLDKKVCEIFAVRF